MSQTWFDESSKDLSQVFLQSVQTVRGKKQNDKDGK